MLADPKQIDKYSEGEIELLEKMFGGDNPTLYVLRNALYQYELTKDERALLDFNPDEQKLLVKIFLPKNSPETPIGWTLNMYQSLTEIKNYAPEGAFIHIKANDILITYIAERLNEILAKGEVKNKIVLEGLPLEHEPYDKEERFINMLAYHNICAYISGRILEIKARANLPVEPTEAEKKAKAQKDSTQ